MVAELYAKLYWTLLASFSVMGLCLAFAQPLFSVPDEPMHWRVAHYRMEHLFGAEGCVPTVQGERCTRRGPCSSVPRFELHCYDELLLYGGVSTYPGVLLSKLILPRQTESATRQIQAVMLSRLLQGLIILACLIRAGTLVRKAGRGGALLLGAFMLSPLVAQQSFSVSSDGAPIAFGICLFAAIVAWEYLGWLDLALFLSLGIGAAAKPSMLPCVLPSVVAASWFARLEASSAPSARELLKDVARAWKPSRAPSVQTLVLWAALLSSVLTVVFSLENRAEETAAAPPDPAQATNLAALSARPWLAFELITRLRYNPVKSETWVGPLGWLDLHPAAAVRHAFLRILVLMFVVELAVLGCRLISARAQPGPCVRRVLRGGWPLLLGLLGPLANVVLMTAIMYVLWSDSEATEAEGVQFRYFIPAVSVSIALLFRTLDLARDRHEETTSPGLPKLSPRVLLTASLVTQVLVLALALPYVSRVFVDLSTRYHDPARY